MADFGDEAGKDVLDNITRMARMPFDEMVRIMLRKMLNGSKNFEPQYNKEGKVESIDLPFDSLREREQPARQPQHRTVLRPDRRARHRR